ncbi:MULTISPECIES: hypothetical protein [unclassified Wolbachia]|uniref:hypothetical protein n=1 Tax=unclassified Wolbachia TaxID=2640676 RepID=UPI0030CA3B5F
MTTNKDQNIWKWENTAHITKMGIEGTVALASLAAAITTILIATKVIAGPASLALVASPAGIAVLFIAAVYFAAQAYSSYQQMNVMEGAKGEALNDNDFNEKVKASLGNPDVTQIFDNKYALKSPGAV